MCADFLDLFWGATGFFNVMMQNLYFVVGAALLHKVDRVMLSMFKKSEVHSVITCPILFPSST